MASISTNTFDLMHFFKARYAKDKDGKNVVVIPVDDESIYRISNNDGVVSVKCSIACLSRYNQSNSESAPTHDFRYNFSQEDRQKMIAKMQEYLTAHPEAIERLTKQYTQLVKQADGSYCYVNKDGKAGEPRTIEQIAAEVTYGKITFGPGWLLKAQTPQPTTTETLQSDDYLDPDSDVPF